MIPSKQYFVIAEYIKLRRRSLGKFALTFTGSVSLSLYISTLLGKLCFSFVVTSSIAVLTQAIRTEYIVKDSGRTLAYVGLQGYWL